MSKNYFLFFSLFFIAISFSFGQNQLIIKLDKEKTETINFLISKGISTIPFYNIPQDKFLKLQNDAIKISGTDSNVTSLKNYLALTTFDQEVLNFLETKNIMYYLSDNTIIPPPGDILPVTPSFVSQQTYLQSNPGLNVEAVWNLGYSGQNVTIHNVEYGFNKNHEEFNDTNCNIATGMTINSSASTSFTEHGTATMGVLFGHNGSYGITGIAHGSQRVWLYPEWQQSGYSRTNAITQALNNSSVGDVIVFEMQAYGLNGTVSNPRFVPAEYDILVWNLTKALTDSGRIVVAAAGNGYQDLNSPDYQTYMGYGDSGAIIVGGGTANTTHAIFPPYVVSGVTYTSTYGSRVDVQGWFENVRTTGAIPGSGFTLVGSDFNQSYMTFTGTSSATAQLGGVVTVLQSYYKSQTNNTLTSQQMRTILKDTGIPQGGDISKNIGPFPNMLAAFNLIQQTLNSESFSENSLLVYPNPSNGIFTLVSGSNKIDKIEVFDVTGKVIMSKKEYSSSGNQISIDIASASQGIYFLKIIANNQSIVKRIIKN
jgi:hypothetical protein